MRLYERDAELRSAASVLRRAADGQGGVLFLAGNAGLGKTALLEHTVRGAGSRFRIGSATGDPVETSVAFSYVGQALDALECPVPLAEVGEGTASVTDIRSAQFHGVLRWLRRIDEPTVIALDDLQWADSDSVALVSFLCRRLDGLPVAVVATLRSYPPAAHDVARRLSCAGHATLAELAPLSCTAAERVVADCLQWPADEQTIKQAVALCGGNPLLLEQVSALIDRGDELTSPDLTRALPNPEPLLLTRFAALPAEVVACAKAASIFGARFRPSLTASVAQIPEQDVERALEALARSGLVREAGDHMAEFTHPLFSQLLYEDLGAALRAALHRRACRVLLEGGLDREAAQHAMRGHLAGDAEAIAVLERVGLEALRQGAAGSAAEHLRAAVALAGQRASRTALIGLSEALLAGGRYREAIDCCERVAARPASSPGELAETLAIHAKSLAQAGRLAEACECLERTVEAAADVNLPLAIDAQTEHGYYRWWMSGPAAALPLLSRARELAAPVLGSARSRATAVWGFVALQGGDPTGFAATATAGRSVLAASRTRLSDFTASWGALASYTSSAVLLEHLPEAEQAYKAALDTAEKSGADLTAGVLGLDVSYADLLIRMGRLEDALRLTAKVLDLADVMPALTMTAGLVHAEALLQLGRADEAATWLARAEAAPAFLASWAPALRARALRGQQALRAGEWEAASTHLRAAEKLSARAGIGEPCMSRWARHAVVSHLRAGRRADAQGVLDWLERCIRRLPCRWPRIAALCGRAVLAELTGDAAAAEAAFGQALDLHEGLDLPLERIETLLEYGTFLRRDGRQARARPMLAEAVSAAEAIGADWLARHAHRELAASGGRRRRGSDNRLTPQERRVLELAARGLSNEAIASRLRVAAGTVKTHLEHIYAKLGVHSRRELMLRCGDTAGAEAGPPAAATQQARAGGRR
ncbi:MAG TPA: AAA family ATPase [Streptosporangiaceae bacterium]